MNNSFSPFGIKYSKPPECRGCLLEHDGRGFSISEGTGALGVLAVGESLGNHEVADGLPLRPGAPAGSVFERGLRKCGFSRDQFATWNVCGCQPPHNDLRGYESAMQHCRVHFRAVMERYHPRVILALGSVALASLTGYAGYKQTVEYVRGYALPCPEFPDVWVVPTYHPSYIVRGAWNVFGAFCRDIRYAVHIAQHGFHPKPVEYDEHSGRAEQNYILAKCAEDPSRVVSADFETEGNIGVYEDEQLNQALLDLYDERRARKKVERKKLGTDQAITSVNISIAERQSFVFEWSPDLIPGCIDILSTPNPKIGHNCFSFDQNVAEYNKVPWNGITDDTMLMFHHLFPDLPGRRGKVGESEIDGSFANLQYCASFAEFDQPWKHLVKDQPGYYGCCDSDATLRLYNRLRRGMLMLAHPNGISIWDSYLTLVAQLWPLLHEASRRGIPTNKEKLLLFLRSVVARQRVVGARIQAVVPSELLPVKNKVGYKKTPTVKCEACAGRGYDVVIDESQVKVRDRKRKVMCEACKGAKRLPRTEGLTLIDYELEAEEKRCKCFRVRTKDVEYWSELAAAEYSQSDGRLRAPKPGCAACAGTGWLRLPARVEARWSKLIEFNPNSTTQMKAYAEFNHHRIPLNKEHVRAMDKWTLDQLAKRTRDPLYRDTIEFRQFEKMTAYAVQWMPRPTAPERGWMYPAAHPEFSYYPATGQLSSFGPNAQNVMSLSKYGPLAVEFRDAIEAPPFYSIVEADLKSFHAQTLGFEAGCPEYIRLAKLDVHSFLAGSMHKLPYFDQCLEWDDKALLEFLKWHRKNFVFPDGTPFQKVRDERAKVGVLAFGLGQSYKSLFESNRDSFLPDWFVLKNQRGALITDRDILSADKEGAASAALVHETLNERFPQLKAYRENTPLLARSQGDRLISRYGCIRWFYDIQHWDSRLHRMVHGTDWEKAIAFPVQNDGHGYLKYALLRLDAPLAHDERGALVRYGFINTVHDSVVFCCANALLDEALPIIKRELERPSEVLVFDDGTGLSVECEIKVGSTWSDMKEVTV